MWQDQTQMRISLIHASRQRVARAEEALLEWTSKRSNLHDIEYILSVDADDPALRGYRALAARHGVALIVGPNRTVVEAVNRGASASNGNLLVNSADDFGCPEGWDLALADLAGDRRDIAIFVSDGYENRLMTLQIIGRDFYARLGHLFHPAYRSMFADDDLTDVARRAGVLIDARHLLFPHRHFIAGMSEIDVTYARENSDSAWFDGWRVYRKRTLTQFGDRPDGLMLRLALARVDCLYYLLKTGSAMLGRRLPIPRP